MKITDSRGWIGVDLDGTMFHYDRWVAWNHFGEPIPVMIRRVRDWIASGRQVRIVTARVGLPREVLPSGELVYDIIQRHQCWHTGARFSDNDMVCAIREHLARHELPPLQVQCFKDVYMMELWDDRAIQVVPNTGELVKDLLRLERDRGHDDDRD